MKNACLKLLDDDDDALETTAYYVCLGYFLFAFANAGVCFKNFTPQKKEQFIRL